MFFCSYIELYSLEFWWMENLASHHDWCVPLCFLQNIYRCGSIFFTWVRFPALIQSLDSMAYWWVSTLWLQDDRFNSWSAQTTGYDLSVHLEWRLDFASFIAQSVTLPTGFLGNASMPRKTFLSQGHIVDNSPYLHIFWRWNEPNYPEKLRPYVL